MKVIINEDIDRNEWSTFLSENKFASVFQSPDYHRFGLSLRGYSSYAIAITDSKKLLALAVITLIIPPGMKGYMSRRAIIYGGPLLNPQYPQAMDLLISSLLSYLKKSVIYLEIRNYNDYHIFRDYFENQKFKYLPHLNFKLSLTGKTLEDVLMGMDYNRRREIRLSLKEGASFGECASVNELKILYGILHELYKKRVRLPLPDFEYFEAIYNSEFGKIFIVKHNDLVIGGSVCPFHPGRSIYTNYYCGIRDYNKKIFPSHLAVWAAIRYGVENGMQEVDFMGAGKPSIDYGVRRYKKEFGGELVEHGRFLCICKPLFFNLGIIGINVMKWIRI